VSQCSDAMLDARQTVRVQGSACRSTLCLPSRQAAYPALLPSPQCHSNQYCGFRKAGKTNQTVSLMKLHA